MRMLFPAVISTTTSCSAVPTDTHIWSWWNLRREVGPIPGVVDGLLFKNDWVVQVYHLRAII